VRTFESCRGGGGEASAAVAGGCRDRRSKVNTSFRADQEETGRFDEVLPAYRASLDTLT
jgi:hypothetical protein